MIGSNVEIDVVAPNWVADARKQIAANISLQVQQYLLGTNKLTMSTKHSFKCCSWAAMLFKHVVSRFLKNERQGGREVELYGIRIYGCPGT